MNQTLQAIQTSDSEELIKHYGVKGMKWGIRRWTSRYRAKKNAKKANRRITRKWNSKYMQRTSMTNNQLRKSIERLRLENDFGEQVKRANALTNPKKGNKGGFGKELTKDVTKQVIKTTIGAGVKTGIDLMKQK